jgi:hypothetical protein
MSNHIDMNDDLHWLAFRYVCGELSADEETAFECRLAEDQAAREAVAAAVELQQAIRVASEPSGRRLAVRRFVWGAAAASILLAVGVWWLAAGRFPFGTDAPSPQPGENVAGDAGAARDLALNWADLQRQPGAEDVAVPEPFVGKDDLPMGEGLGNDVAVPQWMVIALSDEARTTKRKR